MSTNQHTINSAEEFQLLTDKRVALESLINIASGINNQQAALNELALAARPSQDFPKSFKVYFDSIEKRLADDPATDVVKRLEKIDLITDKTLTQILQLSKLDVNSLRTDEVKNINVDGFTTLINDFKRRTQTSLALRYILKRRGVAIAPFRLPVSQEAIHEQVDQLREKENQCVNQIKKEIRIIIKDTDLLMKDDVFSEQMKIDIMNINKAMHVNLAHLEKGGSVTEIPNVFDIITLETEEQMVAQILKDDDNTEVKTKLKSEKQLKKANPPDQSFKKKSTWWLFKKWISSPWSTSWASIKQKYQNPPEQN